jgi:hypothetical protein
MTIEHELATENARLRAELEDFVRDTEIFNTEGWTPDGATDKEYGLLALGLIIGRRRRIEMLLADKRREKEL